MAMPIPFNRTHDVVHGEVEELSPLIRRITAPNGGPFTFRGTGTYIVGRGEVAVIDPGPLDDDHLAALERALEGETIRHILITHTHRDHSPLAAPLKAKHGGTTFGHGRHGAAREAQGVKVPEGGDQDFTPDTIVQDGDIIQGEGYTFECVYTPGHCSNHMCFALKEENAFFSGDHVMGWASTVIVPPDGDMLAYMASLEKVRLRNDDIMYPTHGAAIPKPQEFIGALIKHRLAREDAIIQCIQSGRTTIPEMVARMYATIDPALHPAAGRTLVAHMEKLVTEGRIKCDGPPSVESIYLLG